MGTLKMPLELARYAALAHVSILQV